MKMTKNSKVSGSSIISVCIFLAALGVVMVPAIRYYEEWKKGKIEEQTYERMAKVTEAIKEYAAVHGRYPCPAPLTARMNNPNFGKEISSECDTSSSAASDLTHQSVSTKTVDTQTIPIPVRAGAVPVRTLGLSDEHSFDGYKSRFIYTVTEDYAKTLPLPDISELDNDSMAGIFMDDSNGNNATRADGNIIFTVITLGKSKMGAYGINGTLLQPCNPQAKEGENCDLDGNFINTMNKSDSDDVRNKFTQGLKYESTQPCEAKEKTPEKIAYLLDSSGSMGYKINDALDWDDPANCPPTGRTPSECQRIHMAQWAIRRAVKARQYMMLPENDPTGTYQTYFSRFRGTNPAPNAFTSDRIFYNTDMEAELRGICPNGGTPLGGNIWGLARLLGDGEPGRPNKIIVISDGMHTDGSMTPADAIPQITAAYPNLKVDVIDIGDNRAIADIIKDHGGTYLRSDQPEDIVNFLMKSSNNCASLEVSEPANERFYCAAAEIPPILGGNNPTPTPPGGLPPGYVPACGGYNTAYQYRYYRMPISVMRQNPPPGYTGPVVYRGSATLQGNIIFDDSNNRGSEGVALSVTYKGVTYCLSGGRVSISGDYTNFTMYSDGRYVITTKSNVEGTDTYYPRAIITRDGP
jgi:hypothetical protein